MAKKITKEQFEAEMPVMFSALNTCWEKAYVTDHGPETESIELALEVTEQ